MSNLTTLNSFSQKWLAFTGIALLSFGCYLDYTVVNVALPTMQEELQTSLTSLQWVMNIYFLALCVLATIMGRLGDMFGRRRCLYIGTSLFTLASIVAGCAPSIHWLILGRLLQGVGAAMVFPLGPSLLPESFPENERSKAIAWLGSIGGIALALGPVLGGIIVTYWGWRWIFFINVPIAVLGYLFCFGSLNESFTKQEKEPLDWMGMLSLGFAMSGIVLGLIQSQLAGWNNFLTLFYFGMGFLASVILFNVERKHPAPLIDLSDFSNLLFCAGAILCFLAGVLSSAALFFDPLYLQIILHQSPQTSGLILFAIPIAVFGVAFIIERLVSRFGILHTILMGIALAMISMLLHAFFMGATPLWYITIAFIFLGSMWAMGNTVPIIAAQTAVGPHRASTATGTMVTMFNIGGSIGLALAIVVYQFATSHSLKQLFENKLLRPEGNQLADLEKLIANPAHSLQASVSATTYDLFNTIFLSGFSSVMWFLFALSVVSFLVIWGWKKVRRISIS